MIRKVHILPILCIVLFLHCICSQSVREDANIRMPVRCIEKERQALLMFKQGVVTLSEDYDDVPASLWGSEGNTKECCIWEGVECSNLTGHVTSLDLGYLKHISINLTASLVELKRLESLRLQFNDFGNMPIPKFIGSLTSLNVLDLSYSYLSGPIPYHLKNLSNLELLGLAGNNFASNPLPEFLGSFSKLETLDLAYCNFSGVIPYQLHNLSKLTFLDLSNNNGLFMKDSKWLSHLSSLTELNLGGIDMSRANSWIDDIIKAHPLMSVLRLADCNLTGLMAPSLSSPKSSPSTISQLFISSDNLLYVDLSHNQLTGAVPAFRDCPSLKRLDLSFNQFSAFFPETFGHVPKLHTLDISRNSLEVVITKEHLSNLSSLNDLDLSFNNVAFNLSPQHVSHLQLSTLFLRSCKLGPRFPNWIKTQKLLSRLDLSENEISDSIPTWFWNLTSNGMDLLDLSSNRITGRLPDVNLIFTTVELSSNQLEGPIPKFLANGDRVGLSRNNFSGSLSFLKVHTLDNLFYLDASHNRLSGEIPDCWMNFEKMVILNLAYNNLSGKIPNSMGVLTRLQVLDLQSNKLSGELPMALKNCDSLSFLNLGGNKFSRHIPSWLGGISNLYVLIMRSNKFMGSIPLHICRLGYLQLLDLSGNKISGKVPACFNNFSGMVQKQTLHHVHLYYDDYEDNAPLVWKGMEREFTKSLGYIRSIDLSSNKLNGELPKTTFALVALVALNLSNNDLCGKIPSEIGNLMSLDSLDLSTNRFSGGIPASMSKLTLLSYLDLSSNNLSGKIPEGTQLQLFNASTYAHNYALCGAPLEKKCIENEQPFSQVPFISTKDEDTHEFDPWFYIATTLGFSTTFWGVCGALFFNRRWRHAYFLYLNNLKDWVYVVVHVFIAKIHRI